LIAPTVACNENAAPALLPKYPTAPEVEDAISLKAYSKQQQAWAVEAIGAYSQERAKRRATAECLNKLRQRGIIN
jgi:hypothetical protein